MDLFKIEFNYLKSCSVSIKKIPQLKAGFYKLLIRDLASYNIYQGLLKHSSDAEYCRQIIYPDKIYAIINKAHFDPIESTKIPNLSFFIKICYSKNGMISTVCRLKDYGKVWWLVPR